MGMFDYVCVLLCGELGWLILVFWVVKFLEDAGLHETIEEALKRQQVLARIREV